MLRLNGYFKIKRKRNRTERRNRVRPRNCMRKCGKDVYHCRGDLPQASPSVIALSYLEGSIFVQFIMNI